MELWKTSRYCFLGQHKKISPLMEGPKIVRLGDAAKNRNLLFSVTCICGGLWSLGDATHRFVWCKTLKKPKGMVLKKLVN